MFYSVALHLKWQICKQFSIHLYCQLISEPWTATWRQKLGRGPLPNNRKTIN